MQFIKWPVNIEYVTAILESIIQFEFLLEIYQSIFGCFVKGVGHLHQIPHPAFVTTWIPGILLYSYNVHCVLFTILPVFFYIIKNLRGARRQDLGGAKPLFATP